MESFLDTVRRHYKERGFRDAAIEHLQRVVRQGADADALLRRVGGLTLSEPLPVHALTAQFPFPAVPAVTPGRPNEARAVFAFAFGYRLKVREAPNECERRLPGINNRALAEIAADLKKSAKVPLYAQFEISDALDDYTDVSADFTAPVADLGTRPIAEAFVNAARARKLTLDSVVVAAHGHHMARCLWILKSDFGVQAVPAARSYCGYDPREAQPRVVSPEEFILSDFVSMATHGPWRP